MERLDEVPDPDPETIARSYRQVSEERTAWLARVPLNLQINVK